MNSFAFLLLCAQAFLIQAVYSQYTYGGAYPINAGASVAAANAAAAAANAAALTRGPYYGPGLVGPASYIPEAYQGFGAGNVAVAGDLGVAGSTLVAGQVPVLGAVAFGGALPASGAVTIAGSCRCGHEHYY